jgi:hypothetical protein
MGMMCAGVCARTFAARDFDFIAFNAYLLHSAAV